MIKILITTSTFNLDNLSPLYKNYKKFKITINKSKKKISSKELKKKIVGVDAIIAGTEIYDKKILSYANNLKIICRVGVGKDNIDEDYCNKKKIKILTSKVDLSTPVAEHALGLIFSALKKINTFDNEIKKGKWKKRNTENLYKKKLGIIGFGKVGNKLFDLTKPFKLNCFYFDISKKQKKKVSFLNIKKIFTSCDIISIHLPLNKKTKNIINRKLFNLSKNIILVNTSRGDVINEDDLFRFLIKNKNSIACLDVFKSEPYKGKLSKLSNTILSPHVSGYSFETRQMLEKESVYNILNEFK